MRNIPRLSALLFLLAASPLLFAQPGSSGMAFLKLGVSGRGTAMADAGSAIASGASATYYNPAGLAEARWGRLRPVLDTHRSIPLAGRAIRLPPLDVAHRRCVGRSS